MYIVLLLGHYFHQYKTPISLLHLPEDTEVPLGLWPAVSELWAAWCVLWADGVFQGRGVGPEGSGSARALSGSGSQKTSVAASEQSSEASLQRETMNFSELCDILIPFNIGDLAVDILNCWRQKECKWNPSIKLHVCKQQEHIHTDRRYFGHDRWFNLSYAFEPNATHLCGFILPKVYHTFEMGSKRMQIKIIVPKIILNSNQTWTN